MAITKAIHELRDQLSAVLSQVAATGEEVQITKHGKVIARLVPPEPTGVIIGLGAAGGGRSPSVEDLRWTDEELSDFYNGTIEPG